ncbi:hypothetical protein D3C87_1543410 [compost metagenome]
MSGSRSETAADIAHGQIWGEREQGQPHIVLDGAKHGSSCGQGLGIHLLSCSTHLSKVRQRKPFGFRLHSAGVNRSPHCSPERGAGATKGQTPDHGSHS